MTVSSTIPRSEQPAVDHSPMKKDGAKNYCKTVKFYRFISQSWTQLQKEK